MHSVDPSLSREQTNPKAKDKEHFDTCLIWELGLRDYGEVYHLQKRLHQGRVNDIIPDVVLLLEHPPTFTIGKTGSRKNILISAEKQKAENIGLFYVERGGDVTYHGPGQLVAYPIMDLEKRSRDLRGFVRQLEEVAIRTLAEFSIHATRDEDHAGVWVGLDEIAAIGLSVKKWVSMHGLALNVNTNLKHFSLINPCGFSDRKATSMAAILGHNVPMKQVNDCFKKHFSEIFRVDPVSFDGSTV